MATTTKDGKKSFGSAYAAKRYDSYHAGQQPEASVNDTPKHHNGDHVNLEGADKVAKNQNVMGDSAPHPEEVVREHGPAHTVKISHRGDEHMSTSHHDDGFEHVMSHGSAREAHDSASKLSLEAGGEDQNRDVKKMDHPDQQGAKSETENWEMPDLV